MLKCLIYWKTLRSVNYFQIDYHHYHHFLNLRFFEFHWLHFNYLYCYHLQWYLFSFFKPHLKIFSNILLNCHRVLNSNILFQYRNMFLITVKELNLIIILNYQKKSLLHILLYHRLIDLAFLLLIKMLNQSKFYLIVY